MAANDPVFEYSRAGFKFQVFTNRIDIEQQAILGKKKESILLRNVSSVEVKKATGKIVLKTNDKSQKEYIIGLKVEEAYNAIMPLL